MTQPRLLPISCIALASCTVHAQWQQYQIQRLGLVDPGHAATYLHPSLPVAGANIVGGSSSRLPGNAGADAWIWDGLATIPVGLVGPEHPYGSTVSLVNPTGFVAGYAQRTDGNGGDFWGWNGASSQQIGLFGGVYTGSTGYQRPGSLWGDGAVVAGESTRISGVALGNGQDAWAWNGIQTVQIGFSGGVFTSGSGRQESVVKGTSANGLVAGYSVYSQLGTSYYRDAWAWNGSSTVQIGLVGGNHTEPLFGLQSSTPLVVSASGRIAGSSGTRSFVNGNWGWFGTDSWVWNGSQSVQIGLVGGVYTHPTLGTWECLPWRINDAGQVAGQSLRKNHAVYANGNNGLDAWIWNGNSTVLVGLTDSAHTSTAGTRNSNVTGMTNSGIAVGWSARYDYALHEGDIWLWNGVSTVQLGLTGGVYSDTTGRSQSSLSQYPILNEAGWVVGSSTRYSATDVPVRGDLWVSDGTQTIFIPPPLGSVYTGSEGLRTMPALVQNEAGQISGYAIRYTGVSTQIGNDAWYFDRATGQTHSIVASIRTSDNYAYSYPSQLTADGYLFGQYKFFAGGIGSGELRAFLYRPDKGFADLGSLVDGGLAVNGWAVLASIHPSSTIERILGSGTVVGESVPSVFALIPVAASCPADFNRDLVVDFFDYLDFVEAFSSNSQNSDFNEDGVIDFFDYLDFVDSFAFGC